MNANQNKSFANTLLCTMSNSEFELFSKFIHDEAGIKMSLTKKTMLEARLQKRLRTLGIDNFKEYAEFVFSDAGHDQEIIHLIDVVTTNKTDFFREPHHFNFLARTAIPAMRQKRNAGGSPFNPLRIWSAGCATGEEPYTMAMVLAEYAARTNIRFSVLATDISTNVLQSAAQGVYSEERTDTIPLPLKQKYLLRSKDRSKRLVRIAPTLRSTVDFRRLNLMDDHFGIAEKQDIIFCRNVIIYFDKETQIKLIRKFHKQLQPGGFLFIGHSETLNGLDLPFSQVGNTVYRKD